MILEFIYIFCCGNMSCLPVFCTSSHRKAGFSKLDSVSFWQPPCLEIQLSWREFPPLSPPLTCLTLSQDAQSPTCCSWAFFLLSGCLLEVSACWFQSLPCSRQNLGFPHPCYPYWWDLPEPCFIFHHRESCLFRPCPRGGVFRSCRSTLKQLLMLLVLLLLVPVLATLLLLPQWSHGDQAQKCWALCSWSGK